MSNLLYTPKYTSSYTYKQMIKAEKKRKKVKIIIKSLLIREERLKDNETN